MGVSRCSKSGCDSVMCDRYSREYGYLCSECFQSLVDSGMDVELFLFIPKKRKPEPRANLYEFYDSIFPQKELP